MENINWKVEGMTCSNCALSIHKYLEKEGLKNVKVNPIGGDVSFEMKNDISVEKLAKGIKSLGYEVANLHQQSSTKKPFLSTQLQRFLFCLPFTLPLLLHMIPGVHIHWLMNPWLQLGLTIPVYVVGMRFFGRSAIKSLRNRLPNMDVLISLGATAAFIYSLYGTLTGQAEEYLFYET
ncbi:MAG TPA: cation transporter, partial [Chitinophagaceae bacterium]|nr:cation transporter [Chitinophagaceae bacterium]